MPHYKTTMFVIVQAEEEIHRFRGSLDDAILEARERNGKWIHASEWDARNDPPPAPEPTPRYRPIGFFHPEIQEGYKVGTTHVDTGDGHKGVVITDADDPRLLETLP